ncbi:HAD family hydrolase [Paenibacillus rigui]|nr:HAD family hydrolase [Paenibacillus rigui]
MGVTADSLSCLGFLGIDRRIGESEDVNGIQWIFFDLGDTLVDESPPFEDSIQQLVDAAKGLGYSFGVAELRAELLRAYEEMHVQPMREALARLVPSEDDSKTIRQSMKYRKDKERPFPEAAQIVHQLSERYRLGVIANQSLGTAERLERYGMRSCFQVICSSAELGVAKPDPRIFEQALAEAGCLPGEATMIGDRIDNDVIPAKQMGMKAVWIRQGFARNQPVPAGGLEPDAVIWRLEELLQIF